MFSNFAWSEMLIIACVAIIVVGPKDLPGMLRTFGKTLGSIKRMAGDFQRQFNDAIRETELDELKDMTSTKGFAPLDDAKKTMEEFAQTMKDPVDSEFIDEIEAPAVEEKPKAAKKAPARKPAVRKPAASKTASKANGSKPATTKKAPAKKRAAPKKAAATAKAEAKSTT